MKVDKNDCATVFNIIQNDEYNKIGFVLLFLLNHFCEIIREHFVLCIFKLYSTKYLISHINYFRHGDKCAGVIAAAFNNTVCGVGLAFNAKLGGKI